jgi:hypothetical protein
MVKLIHPDNPQHEIDRSPDSRDVYESAGWVVTSSKEAKVSPPPPNAP